MVEIALPERMLAFKTEYDSLPTGLRAAAVGENHTHTLPSFPSLLLQVLPRVRGASARAQRGLRGWVTGSIKPSWGAQSGLGTEKRVGACVWVRLHKYLYICVYEYMHD